MRALVLAVLWSGSAFLSNKAWATVLINEFVASNGRTIADADGQFEDWLELYNSGEESVDLTGWSLTDDVLDEAPWVFPMLSLDPGEFLVVWASGKDRPDVLELHTDFRLEENGENIVLRNPLGDVVQELEFGDQRRNTSLGLSPDGAVDGGWFFYLEPSPGAPNIGTPYSEKPSSRPRFSPEESFHTSLVQVELSASPADATLYFTVDGTPPDDTSTLYETPIILSGTAVVNAIAYLDGEPLTRAEARTYFIGEPRGIGTLSISAAPEDLWSGERGILANPTQTGRDWERRAAFELIHAGGTRAFSIGCGLRVHGGASRLNSEKKSLRLYFRDVYGPAKLEHDFFSAASAGDPVLPLTRFDQLVLRGGYNDSWLHFSELTRRNAVYLRDELVRRLANADGGVQAHGTWFGVYLNGEYQGLYNLTERIHEDFLSDSFRHDEWDVIKEGLVRNGDDVAWIALLEFVEGSNLADPALWSRAMQLVDVHQLVRYLALQLWADNRDWPARNWYAARPRDLPGARWRFLHWDSEQTFASSTESVIVNRDTLSSAQEQNGDLAKIIAAFLESDDFRFRLRRELVRLHAGLLHPDRVDEILQPLAAEVEREVRFEARRWGGGSLDGWQSAIARLEEFIEGRHAFLIDGFADLATSDAEPSEFPPSPQLPPELRIALITDRPENLDAGDQSIVERLRRTRAQVQVIDSELDGPETVAAEFDLVVLSEDASFGQVVDDYLFLDVPQLVLQPDLLAEAWVPLAATAEHAAPSKRWQVPSGGHPIAAGLPVGALFDVSTRDVSFAFAGGTHASGVSVVARGEDPQDYAVLAAESGVDLGLGFPTSARMVYLALGERGLRHATGPLVRLFDQSLLWALGLPNPPEAARFLRGDVNLDGRVDIADTRRTLLALFEGAVTLDCDDSADIDDDGVLRISDAIRGLDFLFRFGPPPRAPWPTAGLDPTLDSLGCATSE